MRKPGRPRRDLLDKAIEQADLGLAVEREHAKGTPIKKAQAIVAKATPTPPPEFIGPSQLLLPTRKNTVRMVRSAYEKFGKLKRESEPVFEGEAPREGETHSEWQSRLRRELERERLTKKNDN
jgi:hypothetical protein